MAIYKFAWLKSKCKSSFKTVFGQTEFKWENFSAQGFFSAKLLQSNFEVYALTIRMMTNCSVLPSRNYVYIYSFYNKDNDCFQQYIKGTFCNPKSSNLFGLIALKVRFYLEYTCLDNL